jgi:hypothetical protein
VKCWNTERRIGCCAGRTTGQETSVFDVSRKETEWRRPLCAVAKVHVNYLERGSEVDIITSRLFVSLGDWPRYPSFLRTLMLYPQFASGPCPVTLESNPHAHSIFM